MILHGKIKTTKAKAQAVRGDIEKLITKAKKGTDPMRRDIFAAIADRSIVDQLMEMAKTQFTSRNSGYTRITKLGTRLGDATEMVLLSFVDEKVVTEVIAPKTKGKEAVAKKEESKKPAVKEKKETKKAEKPKKK